MTGNKDRAVSSSEFFSDDLSYLKKGPKLFYTLFFFWYKLIRQIGTIVNEF